MCEGVPVCVCVCVRECVCGGVPVRVCVCGGGVEGGCLCACVRDLNQSVCLSGQGRVDLLQLMLDAEATEEEMKANPNDKRT